MKHKTQTSLTVRLDTLTMSRLDYLKLYHKSQLGITLSQSQLLRLAVLRLIESVAYDIESAREGDFCKGQRKIEAKKTKEDALPVWKQRALPEMPKPFLTWSELEEHAYPRDQRFADTQKRLFAPMYKETEPDETIERIRNQINQETNNEQATHQ